ncbi:protein APEM9-like [Zingiber officinale]|uniref:protein APEM9-like n=1 Tax=Zingiber officinale TaxID=94328 RepID=UPI001C4CB999|nr:protein APEM9-like [Zingiber officinale]
MALLSVSAIWDEIDISESYLVCCMFEEATTLAASILHRVLCTPFEDAIDDVQSDEILVSASMVFIQSMKQLKRTEEIIVELRTLFGSVAAIPVQVFLTGACMQISEGYTSNLGSIFEEFLSKWKLVDDKMYILTDAEPQCSDKGSPKQLVMSPEKYLAVAEVYTITVLGRVFHNLNLAISWTEEAELPEESRQVLHRRLHSLLSAQRLDHAHSSSANGSMQIGNETYPKARIQELQFDESKPIANSLKTAHPSKKIADQIFWWFDTVGIKVGNIQLVLPRGKNLLFGFLIILASYILRRRTTTLKRLVARQASVVKGALLDAWRLAFSVQVNPLAAIQQLPSAPQ